MASRDSVYVGRTSPTYCTACWKLCAYKIHLIIDSSWERCRGKRGRSPGAPFLPKPQCSGPDFSLVEGVQRTTVLYLADWPIEEGRAKENRPTPLPWIETKPD